MLLTLTTTHQPATDLGYLLMKNPENVHVTALPFGCATVFYSEATADRCTAALSVEVDAVELVRGKGGQAGLQDQYVNDRPLLLRRCSALRSGECWTAMSGRSKLRQEMSHVVVAAREDVVVERSAAPVKPCKHRFARWVH